MPSSAKKEFHAELAEFAEEEFHAEHAEFAEEEFHAELAKFATKDVYLRTLRALRETPLSLFANSACSA
jgi:DNA-binding GntR family transcriptional regulator